MNNKKNSPAKLKTSARAAALESLLRCERDGRWSNLEIDAAIKKYRLEGAERSLYTSLVYGVVEMRLTLDFIIGELSARPLAALDAEVVMILRLGLYQLIRLDRIPESAAVNESVALTKGRVTSAASFVNAILRGFLRKYGRGSLPLPDKSDMIRYLSVKYSCSEDVVRTLGSEAEAILEAFSRQPATTLRVNTLKISRDELLTRLEADGISAEPTLRSHIGVSVATHSDSDRLAKILAEGLAFVQDEASQIALLAAAPKPGSRVIDACSCPGGKSFSAAMMMGNSGEISSFDLHKNKLSLVESGAKRLGISIISTAERNGSVEAPELEKSADLVLCDAPCSGLGVIAKKPDLRYKSAEEYDRLPEIQYAILSNCARWAKVGGYVVYSTCTLNKAENEAVSSRFADENPDFEPVDFEAADLQSSDGRLTLYPHLHGTDGFYISKFRRLR